LSRREDGETYRGVKNASNRKFQRERERESEEKTDSVANDSPSTSQTERQTKEKKKNDTEKQKVVHRRPVRICDLALSNIDFRFCVAFLPVLGFKNTLASSTDCAMVPIRYTFLFFDLPSR